MAVLVEIELKDGNGEDYILIVEIVAADRMVGIGGSHLTWGGSDELSPEDAAEIASENQDEIIEIVELMGNIYDHKPRGHKC